MFTKTVNPYNHKLAQAVALSLFALAAKQAQAVDYSFSDLDTLAGNSTTKYIAQNLNNLGHVSGYSQNVASGEIRGTMWNGSTWSDLGKLPGAGTQDVGYAINDHDQVTGISQFTPELYKPVRWDNGVAVGLDRLPGDAWISRGNAINDNGQVTGEAWASENGPANWHAVRWDGNAITDLGTLTGGSASFAQSINESGQIVGDGYTANDDFDAAVFWNSDGSIHELQTLSGASSNGWATGINNLGQIVGITADADGNSQSVFWASYTAAPVLLSVLSGYSGAVAADINDAGQIVGWATYDADNASHLILWDQGNFTDLSSLIPAALAADGMSLSNYLTQINQDGAIVGRILDSGNAAVGSYLLTPVAVPVPGAVWLFGSALAGFIGMKRRKQAAL